MNNAIVILSGGIDSSTTSAIAKAQGYSLSALTFDYGQRHKVEIEYAKKVAKFLGIKEHIIFKLDLSQFGGSALTDINIKPPERDVATMSKTEIPVTYVPMRNLVLLSVALSFAEARGYRTVFFGANVLDYSGYPDCRPEFVKALIEAANYGSKIYQLTKQSFKIETPVIYLTKTEIVKKGLELGFDYSLTYSCYNGTVPPCRKCDSCQFRYKAFQECGLNID